MYSNRHIYFKFNCLTPFCPQDKRTKVVLDIKCKEFKIYINDYINNLVLTFLEMIFDQQFYLLLIVYMIIAYMYELRVVKGETHI